jgi:hypothetical protein
MTHEPEPTEDPKAQTDEPELDTEGHSFSNYELSNSAVRDRRRDDNRLALDAARRRELKRPARSLRNRLLGR